MAPEATAAGQDRLRRLEKVAVETPNFIIKYEPLNEPASIGGNEVPVIGSEADAISTVVDLIRTGRTTPGRVQIYANMNAIVETAITFPPSQPRR